MKARADREPYSIDTPRRNARATENRNRSSLARNVFIVATTKSGALDLPFVFSPPHSAAMSECSARRSDITSAMKSPDTSLF